MPVENKLRILEVVQSLEKGGRTTRFTDTVEGLRLKGHYVLPVVFGKPASWVSIDGLTQLDRSMGKLTTILRIRSLIKAHKIDVVHAHCEFTQLYAGLAARLCRVPLVSTFHRSELGKYQPSMTNRIIRSLSDAGVAVSKDRLKLLTGQLGLPADKCEVVHGGTRIDTLPGEADHTTAIQNLGLSKNHFHILSVGHLGAIKGHQDTLKALSELPPDLLQPVMLHIAGSGSDTELSQLTQQAESLGIDSNVIFHGQLDNISDWMTACDLFVLPSHEEAFGLVFIEAGARGRATIATNVGGIPDIINHDETGLLVPPRDSSALSNAIALLMTDNERRKMMGEKAYMRVATCFSTDNMINHYLTIFNRVSS